MTTRLLLSAVCGAALALAQQPAASHRDLKFGPLNDVKVPQPVEYQLPNGMTVFLLEDHELPLFRASALIRVGGRWVPAGKAGLAGIAARVIRTGGTAALPGDKLDEELDRLAASVETGAGESSGSAGISSLKEDAERALVILADLLQNPAFPQDKIDLAKIQSRDSIARRNDDAGDIHQRELEKLLYGKNSPYARQIEYSTVASITRDDLVAWHKKYYQPENVILGVWGDFKTEEMKGLIARTLGAWPKGGQPKPEAPAVDRALAAKPGVYFVAKDDVNQSRTAMALLLGQQNDPDYYALSVMSSVFGGGFSSRMFNRIRTQEGLAYASFAHYAAGMDHPGSFEAQVWTKSESTVKAVQIVKEEMRKITEAEVTDQELQLAKDSIFKGAAFDFDSTAKLINRLMSYEYYGYPPDFLQKYRAAVQKITKADVLRVAKKYLNQDQMVLLVVGNAKEFDQPLSTLGAVTEVDITIPPPPGAKVSEATPESEAKGKALLARARSSHGGAKLDAVKDFSGKTEMKINTPQGEMAINNELAVNLEKGGNLMKMITPMGEVVQGFDGEKAWAKSPQGIQDAPPAMNTQAKQALARQNMLLLRNAANYKVQATGVEKIEGADLEGVVVSNGPFGDPVRLYFDPSTGRLAAKRYVGSFMGPPGEITEIYQDYKEFDGVQVPMKTTILNAGKKAAETRVTEYKINPGLPPSTYAKP